MRKMLLFVLFITISLYADIFGNKSEIYFKFIIFNKAEILKITKIISIDKVCYDTVWAYANKKEYDKFSNSDVFSRITSLKILENPGYIGDSKVTDYTQAKRQTNAWDTYPTYDSYVSTMQKNASSYPELCKYLDAGSTVKNRKILFNIITSNVKKGPKPRIMLSSTMHGDETTGFVLMLRLIDTLLASYNTNANIKKLIDSNEIWINPNANPDGTYYSSNSSLNSAQRYNYNGVDLNRNFPDEVDGNNPDGYSTQPETKIMMDLANKYMFTLSVNFHGGAECVNYPYDNMVKDHPDKDWFYQISREYADTCHAQLKTYMMELGDSFTNGVTNGYAWYSVAGGRQDYYTYFKRGREVTIELSSTKKVTASQLPKYWNYNRKSLFNYIRLLSKGIRGCVADSITRKPIYASIFVTNHDKDNSDIYSDSTTGYFHRLIKEGTYNVVISAPGYNDKIMKNIVLKKDSLVTLEILLSPKAKLTNNIHDKSSGIGNVYLRQNYPNPFNPSTTIEFSTNIGENVKVVIYNMLGEKVKELVNEYKVAGEHKIQFDASSFSSGIYICKVAIGNYTKSIKMNLLK